MTLLDLIPLWVALTASALTAFCLWGAIRLRVLYNIVDPGTGILFQACFTFWVLIFIRLLPFGDALGYALFFIILVAVAQNKWIKSGKPLIPEQEWLSFSYIFIILLFVLNIYLITKKGILWSSDNLDDARLDFYYNWGIFKRLNEFGVGVIGLSGFCLWSRGAKKLAMLYFLFTACLILTLGSRAGLLVFLVLYGAYARFAVERVRAKILVLVGAVLGLSSFALFYVMFGAQFLLMFGERVIGYCDGPVYFFFCKLSGKVIYDPGYAFDSLLIALRLRETPAYVPVGQVLNWYFLRYVNPLTGPNPQFCVEAHVMYGPAYLFWYAFVAFAFVYLRKKTSTCFSFFAIMTIVGPLLVDSTFAGSQVFSAALVLGLLFMVRYLRRLLLLASRSARAEHPLVAG
jgi:hypothetical protein